MNRKELAKELCIGSETLRYYEKLGIIDKPRRAGNNYRDYSEDDLRQSRRAR
jgi:DNA-binding transcriptional MerR regulator